MRTYYKSGGEVRKTAKGASLKRWFKEDWKDVRTGKACGRKKGESRGTPYCRPSKRVSGKTPKTSSEMSASENVAKLLKRNGWDNLRVNRVGYLQLNVRGKIDGDFSKR